MPIWDVTNVETEKLKSLVIIDHALRDMKFDGLDGLDEDMMAEVKAELKRRDTFLQDVFDKNDYSIEDAI